jgi:hypothetical protein
MATPSGPFLSFNFPFWSLNTMFLLVNTFELVYVNGTVWFCMDGFSFVFVAEFKQGDNNTEDATSSGIGGVVEKLRRIAS